MVTCSQNGPSRPSQVQLRGWRTNEHQYQEKGSKREVVREIEREGEERDRERVKREIGRDSYIG